MAVELRRCSDNDAAQPNVPPSSDEVRLNCVRAGADVADFSTCPLSRRCWEKQTSKCELRRSVYDTALVLHLSAIGGKADKNFCAANVCF
jgi:hypothetical protein